MIHLFAPRPTKLNRAIVAGLMKQAQPVGDELRKLPNEIKADQTLTLGILA